MGAAGAHQFGKWAIEGSTTKTAGQRTSSLVALQTDSISLFESTLLVTTYSNN